MLDETENKPKFLPSLAAPKITCVQPIHRERSSNQYNALIAHPATLQLTSPEQCLPGVQETIVVDSEPMETT